LSGRSSRRHSSSLADKLSGQDLTQFFKVWIFQAEKPAPGSW
jgi:hypothetical protein